MLLRFQPVKPPRKFVMLGMRNDIKHRGNIVGVLQGVRGHSFVGISFDPFGQTNFHFMFASKVAFSIFDRFGSFSIVFDRLERIRANLCFALVVPRHQSTQTRNCL